MIPRVGYKKHMNPDEFYFWFRYKNLLIIRAESRKYKQLYKRGVTTMTNEECNRTLFERKGQVLSDTQICIDDLKVNIDCTIYKVCRYNCFYMNDSRCIWNPATMIWMDHYSQRTLIRRVVFIQWYWALHRHRLANARHNCRMYSHVWQRSWIGWSLLCGHEA